MDFLTYEATLPAVPANTDVVSQELSIVANGTSQPSQTLAASVTKATFEVLQGAAVDLSLVYIDDAGNTSAAQKQSFVATDTIPPAAPGAFGEIKVVSERTQQ